MRLGIDASNLRSGGGITHLVGLLGHARPETHGFETVRIWSGRRTLEQLPNRAWLEPRYDPALDASLATRLIWQRWTLPRLARGNCDVIFAPGGSCTGAFRPVVTMSRNMLPFELFESLRYGLSPMLCRNVLLRFAQTRSYRRADGMIFVSEYARQAVRRVTGELHGSAAMIPHGVDRRFFLPPRQQRSITGYCIAEPFRLLYPSTVDVYKHQWHVVDAVSRLRREGLPVVLDLIGPSFPASLKRLRRAIRRNDPREEFIRYRGAVSHERISTFYHQAHAFVFAASCENMPNILLEAMASGLPIACSKRGPMPEILGEGGLYFNPLDPDSIAQSLRELVADAELRGRCAQKAFERAQAYSWERCADETFSFLQSVAMQHNQQPLAA